MRDASFAVILGRAPSPYYDLDLSELPDEWCSYVVHDFRDAR